MSVHICRTEWEFVSVWMLACTLVIKLVPSGLFKPSCCTCLLCHPGLSLKIHFCLLLAPDLLTYYWVWPETRLHLTICSYLIWPPVTNLAYLTLLLVSCCSAISCWTSACCPVTFCWNVPVAQPVNAEPVPSHFQWLTYMLLAICY